MACCIVSPQLWTDVSCSWTGPLAVRWWCHSIYVAQTSMIYGILILIHCSLPSSIYFASVQIASVQADHPQTKHTLSWSLWGLAHHPWILQPQPNLWHSSMWKMQWKGQTIRILKETRCHSGKIVFKELDLVRFNVSCLLVLYALI